jgi:hypothetical protein
MAQRRVGDGATKTGRAARPTTMTFSRARKTHLLPADTSDAEKRASMLT